MVGVQQTWKYPLEAWWESTTALWESTCETHPGASSKVLGRGTWQGTGTLLRSGAVSCQDWNVSKNLALVVYRAHLKPWDIVIIEYFKHM